MRSFRKDLITRLKDPVRAQGYYAAILEEAQLCKSNEEAQKLILAARVLIAEAQGGMKAS